MKENGGGRNLGQKKGGGVGVIMKKEERSMVKVQLWRKAEEKLGHCKGDVITLKITDVKV